MRRIARRQNEVTGSHRRQTRQPAAQAGHPVSEGVRREIEETPHAVLADPAAGRHSTEVLTDWVGRCTDAFDTESREWIAGRAAGDAPTGPSARDGYAAAVLTAATVEALESGRVVATDLEPRPAFRGNAA
ncbi:hypothetical protein ADK64_41680 [Streptomyces sp. MMG1121]|nr:hypothetical protein ADK64_41680 [Streptomyces sp. MMG1121]